MRDSYRQTDAESPSCCCLTQTRLSCLLFSTKCAQRGLVEEATSSSFKSPTVLTVKINPHETQFNSDINNPKCIQLETHGSDGSHMSQITLLQMGNLRMEMLLENLPEVFILAQWALLKSTARWSLFLYCSSPPEGASDAFVTVSYNGVINELVHAVLDHFSVRQSKAIITHFVFESLCFCLNVIFMFSSIIQP